MAIQSKIDKDAVSAAKKSQPASYNYQYDFKDTILYNLSVGASTQGKSGLRYW